MLKCHHPTPEGSVHGALTPPELIDGLELCMHKRDPACNLTLIEKINRSHFYHNERRVEVSLPKVLNEIGAPCMPSKQSWTAADALTIPSTISHLRFYP
jgi:hypothetical protein